MEIAHQNKAFLYRHQAKILAMILCMAYIWRTVFRPGFRKFLFIMLVVGSVMGAGKLIFNISYTDTVKDVNAKIMSIGKPVTLFSKTVSRNDADQHGRVKVFRWGAAGERIGDVIEFEGSGKIYQGPGQWQTVKGVHKVRIQKLTKGKWLGVWIPENGKLTVRLKR